MCHDAIFPFYGALSTMPPNIWQYYTALHEHHYYAAQNPDLHSPFKAIGSERPLLLWATADAAQQTDFFSASPLFFFFFLSLAFSCFRAPGFCQHKNGTVRTNAKTRT